MRGSGRRKTAGPGFTHCKSDRCGGCDLAIAGPLTGHLLQAGDGQAGGGAHVVQHHEGCRRRARRRRAAAGGLRPSQDHVRPALDCCRRPVAAPATAPALGASHRSAGRVCRRMDPIECWFDSAVRKFADVASSPCPGSSPLRCSSSLRCMSRPTCRRPYTSPPLNLTELYPHLPMLPPAPASRGAFPRRPSRAGLRGQCWAGLRPVTTIALVVLRGMACYRCPFLRSNWCRTSAYHHYTGQLG